MKYERIRAEDIRPGDRVARARTRTFREVKGVSHFPRAVRISYQSSSDRPRREALWWREV